MEIGERYVSSQMLSMLRPEASGYASPAKLKYVTEQRQQFQSLDREEQRSLLISNVKSKKETAKALRLFEVYNPDSVNQALKQQLITNDKT